MNVRLTFDAEHPGQRQCPPGVVDGILDVLEQEGAPAMFFLQGRWANAYPDTARRIAEAHPIGLHGFAHVAMDRLTPAGFTAEVRAAEEAVGAVTAVRTAAFRLPHGAGHDDRLVLEQLGELGYHHVHWDVFAADWTPARTAGSIVSSVMEQLHQVGGGTVLLHTWPAPTLEALPEILARLRAAGAVLTP